MSNSNVSAKPLLYLIFACLILTGGLALMTNLATPENGVEVGTPLETKPQEFGRIRQPLGTQEYPSILEDPCTECCCDCPPRLHFIGTSESSCSGRG